ncbi:M50 family metallopeptidase [Salipaludibacillus daqingensis]|uniref:M50 family metallopeptidase n=1 Tax=Salipaludibacillus daqingensis TaxID=3041001 RepID=UPI0024745090|nr:M50 family metallopeptidase [Salipaludibacillus daqingensis]
MIELIKKIKIHPLFWLILSIGGITGLFKEIIILFMIVFVHEIGHALMAYHLGWRIKRIILLPFGGMAEMEEHGNKRVKEEILVTLSGPLQHVWMIAGSYLLVTTSVWSEADHHMFLFHNLTILLFNLLPIMPLDGGKFLFSLNTLFLPFQKSYQLSFRLSFMILLGLTYVSLFVFPFHLNLVAVLLFLWTHLYLEWKQRHYHFLRFLMERKRLNSFREKRYTSIDPMVTVAEAMKRIYREKEMVFLFTIDSKKIEIKEEKLLKAFFESENKNAPLHKLIS